MGISVIITTYTRYQRLDSVIRSWLLQPIDELWILDGGGKFKSEVRDERLLIFNMPKDLGTKMDYVFALLTEGEHIILADDDVIVKEGFVHDLHHGWLQTGGIVGIIGRIFNGPHYHGDTTYYRSDNIDRPIKVGFCGVVCFTSRRYFGFDVKGMPRNCDDLWWQMRCYPMLSKYVVPTKNYSDLPECKDSTAMYKNLSLRKQRDDFYTKYYLQNKEP